MSFFKGSIAIHPPLSFFKACRICFYTWNFLNNVLYEFQYLYALNGTFGLFQASHNWGLLRKCRSLIDAFSLRSNQWCVPNVNYGIHVGVAAKRLTVKKWKNRLHNSDFFHSRDYRKGNKGKLGLSTRGSDEISKCCNFLAWLSILCHMKTAHTKISTTKITVFFNVQVQYLPAK